MQLLLHFIIKIFVPVKFLYQLDISTKLYEVCVIFNHVNNVPFRDTSNGCQDLLPVQTGAGLTNDFPVVSKSFIENVAGTFPIKNGFIALIF